MVGECATKRPPAQLSGQGLAALTTTCGHDRATCAGAHAGAEAVHACATTVIRLVSTLRHGTSLLKTTRGGEALKRRDRAMAGCSLPLRPGGALYATLSTPMDLWLPELRRHLWNVGDAKHPAKTASDTRSAVAIDRLRILSGGAENQIFAG